MKNRFLSLESFKLFKLKFFIIYFIICHKILTKITAQELAREKNSTFLFYTDIAL